MEQDNTLYRIRPLEWDDSTAGAYTANIPGGWYDIQPYGYDKNDESIVKLWMVRVSLSANYWWAETLEEAKQLAQQDWLKRILPALEEVKA